MATKSSIILKAKAETRMSICCWKKKKGDNFVLAPTPPSELMS